MSKQQEVYSFTEGDLINLDQIYAIQGLAGNDWWDYVDDIVGDELVVTKTIKIQVTWWC